MKILKKIVCILLSSMFLLFAGACDLWKSPGEKQYFLSTKDEQNPDDYLIVGVWVFCYFMGG